MQTSNKNILVYGIGNDILTDDAIGPKLVKKLAKEYPNTDVHYETAFLGGLDVLEYIQGYKAVIFIDAIKTQNGTPGDIYLLTPDNFKETSHLSSVHDVSFLTALELGRRTGYEVPEDIHIIAIEIIEDLVFNDSFTPEIEAKFPEIYNTVLEFVQEVLSKYKTA